MWTVEPLLISEINRLPIFEILFIIFFSSFTITAIRLTIRKQWMSVLKQPLFIWLVGIMGICLSDFAYIFGAQQAPIAHVDLIDYLWPCFVIGFSGLLPNEKIHFQHIFGAILGLVGIYILIAHDVGQDNISMQYLAGYILAIVGALLWGGYSAFSRYHKAVPTEMIGMYCGMGALICLGLHLQFETFVMPTTTEWVLTVVTGISGAGIAYQLWDHGVKYGNIYILSVVTYLARLLAMLLLVIFGKEPFSVSLVIACVLSSFGVFISSMDNNRFNQFLRKLYNLAKFNKPLVKES
jgi:drug/metabolite transporter (DMT)-like permease